MQINNSFFVLYSVILNNSCDYWNILERLIVVCCVIFCPLFAYFVFHPYFHLSESLLVSLATHCYAWHCHVLGGAVERWTTHGAPRDSVILCKNGRSVYHRQPQQCFVSCRKNVYSYRTSIYHLPSLIQNGLQQAPKPLLIPDTCQGLMSR